jgi:hypothetical protein
MNQHRDGNQEEGFIARTKRVTESEAKGEVRQIFKGQKKRDK